MSDFALSSNDTAPGVDALEITPSDGADIGMAPCRALHVGGSGNLSVDMASGRTVLFTGVPAGVLPIQVRRVRATGTTATGIVAIY